MSMPCVRWIPACVAGMLVAAAQAASPLTEHPITTARAVHPLAAQFDAAWARQPEAQSLGALRAAVEAQTRAAAAWSAAPPALELAERNDRGAEASGFRERELGVAVPLWWPGERAGAQAVADSAAAAIESRHGLARLRLAGELREAWWAWQQARITRDLAEDRHIRATTLAADVARRVAAGDLAPVDQLQADAAVAAADAERAATEAELAATAAALQALSGTLPDRATAASREPADAAVDTPAASTASSATPETPSSRGATHRGDLDLATDPAPEPEAASPQASSSRGATRRGDLDLATDLAPEPEAASPQASSSRGATRRGDPDPTTDLAPEPDPPAIDLAGHPQLIEARDQLRAAEAAATLASAQRGEHLALRLVATREREARFGPEAESLTLGLSLPLGGGTQRREQIARTEAAVDEARARLTLDAARLEAARAAAEARIRAARLQRAAHATRARLAGQALTVQQAAFEAGETDLPTRLRAEADAAEADRAAAQARIAEAAAISAWRQALGLLPQ